MKMHPTPRRRAALALIAAGVLALGVAERAAAQIGQLEAVAVAQQLTPAQEAEVRAYVESNKAGLSAEQASAIRRARMALQDPLRVRGVTPLFRQRYSDALTPVLRPLVAHARDEVAVNALKLAGDLGTKQGMDLLDLGLADKRQNVRFMAASSYRGSLRTAREGVAAISNTQALSAVATLQRAMSAETDPMVQDALFLALDGATEVPSERLEGVRDRAAVVLASGAGQFARRQAAGAVAYAPIIHAGKTLFDLLSNPNIKLPAPALVEAGGFAGDVAAMARRRLGAGAALDDTERAQLGLAVGQAARVYFFAAQNLGAKPGEIRADDAIGKGEDDRFRAEVAKLIDAPDGALLKPPFGLPADRFKGENANAAAGNPRPASPPNP